MPPPFLLSHVIAIISSTISTSQTVTSFTFGVMASIPYNPSGLTAVSPHLSPSFLFMKDLSLFLLKNSLSSKMKRGIRSFCSGIGSTLTLNQGKTDADVSCIAAPSLSGSYMEEGNLSGSPKTLEEMLLQLDLEEVAARRAKLDDYGELNRRMSCVNNSDILRSARNALNQYPRFSLDGRDAMYRSSFRNFGSIEGGRKSVYAEGPKWMSRKDGYEMDLEKSLRMPPTVAGESVVWCKPSVVAKLMGLEAVPVPVPCRSRHRRRRLNPKPNQMASRSRSRSRSRNLRRMRYELETDRIAMSMSGCREKLRRESLGSSSGSAVATGYCMMKPVSVEPERGCGEGWQRAWH